MIVLWIVAAGDRVEESLAYLLVGARQVFGDKRVGEVSPDGPAPIIVGAQLFCDVVGAHTFGVGRILWLS